MSVQPESLAIRSLRALTPLLFHQTERLPVNVPKHTPDITRCLQELSSGDGDVSRLSSRQQIVVNLSVCCKIIYDTCMYAWSRGTDSLQVLKREPCGFVFFLNAIQFCSPLIILKLNILCVVLRMLCKKKCNMSIKCTWNNSQSSSSASAGRVKWQRLLVNATKADHLYTLESARRCNGLSSIARHLAYARSGWGRG